VTRVLMTAQGFRWRFWNPAGVFSGDTALWLILFAAFLQITAWFPIYNLRFTNADNYSRATSLAVLSAGQPWEADFSVPLLVPLRFLGAASAPAVLAFSGPILAAVFAVGAGFLAWQYTKSRLAAFLGAGLAMIATAWGVAGSGEPGRVEMAAAYALLAFGLAPRLPSRAVMAALIAVSISQTFWVWLIAGGACALLAGLVAAGAQRVPIALRPKLTAAAACIFTALLCGQLKVEPTDGPFQYEAAARVCDRVAGKFARNTWMVVSPSHELPFLYGRGWHMELTDFVSSLSRNQIATPSFRFPYAVRDVFFFIENEPLSPGGSVLTLGARAGLDLTRSYEAAFIAYTTPLGRASLEYRAGELLAAYASTHDDLETLHSDGRLAVYHVSIKQQP
ncbi:MAG: hypothetical protein ABJF23_17710, partial [Bryobacteraceae bacterium]